MIIPQAKKEEVMEIGIKRKRTWLRKGEGVRLVGRE